MGEMLKVFNDKHEAIGEMGRDEVHRKGMLHETFHCWIVVKDHNADYLLFQKRAETKKEFPNLLDISAAGHLNSDETKADGVREIREELGLDIPYDELLQLGTIQDEFSHGDIRDRELCHVHLYICENIPSIAVQTEEVDAVFAFEFQDVLTLAAGRVNQIRGYKVEERGHFGESHHAAIDEFVTASDTYYHNVFPLIRKHL